QSAVPFSHELTLHSPASHCTPATASSPILALQLVPDSSLHPPQWASLVFALTSHPLSNIPSQSKRLLAQASIEHAPEAQLTAATPSSPTMAVQSFMQLPQYSALDSRSASQPFEKIPSQSPELPA